MVRAVLAVFAAGALVAFGPSRVANAAPGVAVAATGPTGESAAKSPESGQTEYHDEIERDFPLRSIGQLLVTNMRGDVVIQGWALDRIRVRARRRVLASSETEAKKLLSAVDFRFRSVDGDIELSAEYGRGLDLQERLHERAQPRTGMEMDVFAPANLKLRVWAVDGKVLIRSWGSAVEARTNAGPITVDGVKGESVLALCPACAIRVHSVRASIRCMGGSGGIELSGVKGSEVYAETGSAPIRAESVEAEQLYVSKSGALSGRALQGRIEFHTQQGAVELSETRGFISGKTENGDIRAQMREWTFADKALVESAKGNIVLGLPPSFSGDVDLRSGTGRVEMAFSIEKSKERNPAPLLPNHVVGRVGEGGELLRVFSETGDVRILKGY